MTSTLGATVACRSRVCSRPSMTLMLITMGAYKGMCSPYWDAVLHCRKHRQKVASVSLLALEHPRAHMAI